MNTSGIVYRTALDYSVEKKYKNQRRFNALEQFMILWVKSCLTKQQKKRLPLTKLGLGGF